jgi:SWIM/SEC-C metal-binding protein
MVKLGSRQHPAVVRVQDSIRAQEVLAICHEYDWQVIIGIEPDKSEDISDVEKLLNPPKPILSAHLKIGRNEACHCGSGKKFKKCCLEV